MLAVSKEEVLDGSRGELTLDVLSPRFTHLGESKGLKAFLIRVESSSGDADQRSFWYKRAIRERKDLYGLACDGH